MRGKRKRCSVIVKNTEYVSQITCPAATASAKANFVLNPGDATLFPWLSSIALNFEEYKFKKLKVIFLSGLGTGYRGAVYLGFDPDIKDPVYTSAQQLMTAEYAVRGQVHEHVQLDIPEHAMDTIGRKRYVAATSTSDRTGDAGRLYAWIEHLDSSISSNVLVGELMVEYEVELAVPQFRVNQLAYEGYSRWEVIVDENSSADVWKIPYGLSNTTPRRVGELLAQVGTSWSGTTGYQFLNFPKTGAFLIKLSRWYQDHVFGSENADWSPAVASSDLKDVNGTNLVPTLIDIVFGDSADHVNGSMVETWGFQVPENVYLQNADTGTWGASPANGTRPAYTDAMAIQIPALNKLAPSINCDAGMLLETIYSGARAFYAATTYDVSGRQVRVSDDIPERVRTKYLRKLAKTFKELEETPHPSDTAEFPVVHRECKA
jgi:hypothetical protein